MTTYLEILTPERRSVTLRSGTNRIGRGRDCDIRLGDPDVSRHHAVIYLQNGQFFIQDDDSSTGTLVNGQRIQRAALNDGDILRLGQSEIRFIQQAGGQPATDGEITIRWEDPATGEPEQYSGPTPVVIGRSREQSTIALKSTRISRQHVKLERDGSQIILTDLNSANGTLVNQQRVQRVALGDGDGFQVGPFSVTVTLGRQKPTYADQGYDRPYRGEFPPDFFNNQTVVPVNQLRGAGYPLQETTYLALGGGIGSFVWVDHLLIYGARQEDIAVIGPEPNPYGKYRRLCQYSRIPDHERLRSDSGSTPDNIWGWPGYAMREIASLTARGRLDKAVGIGWQIFGEPTLAQTYTPVSSRVFDSMDREARRIGWRRMWQYGTVRAIRKTDDGRFAVAYSVGRENQNNPYRFIIGRYVHLAMGYPGIKLLPDVREYRESEGDTERVVNAYEEHSHIYDNLARSGGRVLVRGRGIVASRIIQQLYELRQRNQHITIINLNRNPKSEGQAYKDTRRRVENHWEFQPFNWPKGAWGGTHRELLETSDDDQRGQLLGDWGGTTTADRKDWRQMIDQGQREGWYLQPFGAVKRIYRGNGPEIIVEIKGRDNHADTLRVDYIIDATGLVANIDSNPVMHDLIATYSLPRNNKNNLFVSNQFEVEQMRNQPGRMYASGVMTLGGPMAAVDSFLGLQYTAQRSVDDLAKQGAPGLHYLNGLRSINQFIKWAAGAAP